MSSLYIICQLWILAILTPCNFTYLYGGSPSDFLHFRISTWKISNLHVDIFYFPRGRDSFSPKFHLIPPKSFFLPHVEIWASPRGNFEISTWESLFPDIVPYRYVVDSKLLWRASIKFPQGWRLGRILNKILYLCGHISYESSNEETV